MTLCAKQDSCPVLLAAIEAKVEAESMARTAKHNLDAATQAFETKRTLFNEFYKLAVQCRKAQQQYHCQRNAFNPFLMFEHIRTSSSATQNSRDNIRY
jgi:hypothetical protein